MQVFKVPHAVIPNPGISILDFRNRFTHEEKVSIYTAAESDVNVRIFLDDLSVADYILLTNQQIIDGVNYLVSQSIIASDRANEILNISIPFEPIP